MLIDQQHISTLIKIASKQSPDISVELDENLVGRSLEYLESRQALESFEIDAYWPKWNSPWWHMLLLHEMQRTKQIPETMIERVITSLDRDYLKTFPVTEDEVPADLDPIKNIACHCQLGTMQQLLTTYGINCDERMPWIRARYLRYQLHDGGLNCDEAAYTKPVPKSSVVSTLPPLEAIILRTARAWTEEEINFLDRGAGYLIEKRLFRTSTNRQPIDRDWLKLCFPRFYHYDVLRGLSFLTKWSRRLKRKLPIEAVNEVIEHIDAQFPSGRIEVQRAVWSGATSRFWDSPTRTWSKGPATEYSLLSSVGSPGVDCPYLTQSWSEVKADLAAIIDEGLIGSTN